MIKYLNSNSFLILIVNNTQFLNICSQFLENTNCRKCYILHAAIYYHTTKKIKDNIIHANDFHFLLKQNTYIDIFF